MVALWGQYTHDALVVYDNRSIKIANLAFEKLMGREGELGEWRLSDLAGAWHSQGVSILNVEDPIEGFIRRPNGSVVPVRVEKVSTVAEMVMLRVVDLTQERMATAINELREHSFDHLMGLLQGDSYAASVIAVLDAQSWMLGLRGVAWSVGIATKGMGSAAGYVSWAGRVYPYSADRSDANVARWFDMVTRQQVWDRKSIPIPHEDATPDYKPIRIIDMPMRFGASEESYGSVGLGFTDSSSWSYEMEAHLRGVTSIVQRTLGRISAAALPRAWEGDAVDALLVPVDLPTYGQVAAHYCTFLARAMRCEHLSLLLADPTSEWIVQTGCRVSIVGGHFNRVSGVGLLQHAISYVGGALSPLHVGRCESAPMWVKREDALDVDTWDAVMRDVNPDTAIVEIACFIPVGRYGILVVAGGSSQGAVQVEEGWRKLHDSSARVGAMVGRMLDISVQNIAAHARIRRLDKQLTLSWVVRRVLSEARNVTTVEEFYASMQTVNNKLFGHLISRSAHWLVIRDGKAQTFSNGTILSTEAMDGFKWGVDVLPSIREDIGISGGEYREVVLADDKVLGDIGETRTIRWVGIEGTLRDYAIVVPCIYGARVVAVFCTGVTEETEHSVECRDRTLENLVALRPIFDMVARNVHAMGGRLPSVSWVSENPLAR